MAGENNEIVHIELTVSGRVQGVGYRYAAYNQASKLGLKGFVRNNYDGSVGLELEGSTSAVDLMINWCKHGPRTARVENVLIIDGAVRGYKDFKVKY